jgi:hypothetical protein
LVSPSYTYYSPAWDDSLTYLDDSIFYRDASQFLRDYAEIETQGIAALSKQLNVLTPIDGEAFLAGRTAARLC